MRSSQFSSYFKKPQTPFEVPSETPFRPEPEGDVVKKYRLRDGVNFLIFNILVFVRNGGKDDSVRLLDLGRVWSYGQTLAQMAGNFI